MLVFVTIQFSVGVYWWGLLLLNDEIEPVSFVGWVVIWVYRWVYYQRWTSIYAQKNREQPSYNNTPKSNANSVQQKRMRDSTLHHGPNLPSLPKRKERVR